jgi:nucleotide-binding universal stress UspA family protein
MLRSILVGLDGSGHSDAALAVGERWAKAAGARLVGLAVAHVPEVTDPKVMGSAVFRMFGDDGAVAVARGRAERLAERFARRCQETGVEGRPVVSAGDPARMICKHAERSDLILLGTETFFKQDALGDPCDTLEGVLQSPPRPVVAVPENPGNGGTVVIGYDGSVQAARTLSAYVATGLAPKFEHVVVTIDDHEADAARTAAFAVDYLTLHGATARPKTVETRLDPGVILLDHTKQLKAQLLVMGAFGHSPERESFFGSTTRAVLRGTAVPVMLFF